MTHRVPQIGCAKDRLILRRIDAAEDTSVGLVVASFFIDSVWSTKLTFRCASLLTFAESIACIYFYARSHHASRGMGVSLTVAIMLIIAKAVLHFLVMERKWNRRFEMANRRGSVESSLPDAAEVKNPMQSKRDEQVPRAVADANTAGGMAGAGRRVANMFETAI